jgi:hypothetical protein
LRRSFSSNADTSDWKLFHSVIPRPGAFVGNFDAAAAHRRNSAKMWRERTFGFYGNERNNHRLDSCVIRSADLYQDFVAELFAWLEGHLGGRGNA